MLDRTLINSLNSTNFYMSKEKKIVELLDEEHYIFYKFTELSVNPSTANVILEYLSKMYVPMLFIKDNEHYLAFNKFVFDNKVHGLIKDLGLVNVPKAQLLV